VLEATEWTTAALEPALKKAWRGKRLVSSKKTSLLAPAPFHPREVRCRRRFWKSMAVFGKARSLDRMRRFLDAQKKTVHKKDRSIDRPKIPPQPRLVFRCRFITLPSHLCNNREPRPHHAVLPRLQRDSHFGKLTAAHFLQLLSSTAPQRRRFPPAIARGSKHPRPTTAPGTNQRRGSTSSS